MERILLVEDDATIVAALTQFLRSEGFSVQSASGQTEALAAMEAADAAAAAEAPEADDKGEE